MTSIVYCIQAPDGRAYIGATSNWAERRRTHRRHLRRGHGVNKLLQASWDADPEGHKFFAVASALRRGDIHLVERDVIEAFGAELNVNTKPGPLPGPSLGCGRAYGPHPSVAEFSRFFQITFRQGKYLSQRYAYDEALNVISTRGNPRPPKVKPPPKPPAWQVSVGGVVGSPTEVRRAYGIGKRLYQTRRQAGMTPEQAISAGAYEVRKIHITVGDTTLTLGQWARKNGLTSNRIHQRRFSGWTDAQAVGEHPAPVHPNHREVTARGRALRPVEWSAETGIPASLITARIDTLGWTPEQAVGLEARPLKLKKPRGAPKKPPYTCGALSGTLTHICRELNLPYAKVHYQMLKGLSIEEAVAAVAP